MKLLTKKKFGKLNFLKQCFKNGINIICYFPNHNFFVLKMNIFRTIKPGTTIKLCVK